MSNCLEKFSVFHETSMNQRCLTPEDEKPPLPPFNKGGFRGGFKNWQLEGIYGKRYI